MQKVLGPALTEIGEDLKKLYAKGRDKLIAAAYRKLPNPDDGKQANLRVTRDVLWNGAFTQEDICAEYFGGILASSRSKDGKDDDAIHFLDVIKSLSTKQLHLHYVVYNSLNKSLLAAGQPVNVGASHDIYRIQLYFARGELDEGLSLRVETDLTILRRLGLLIQYRNDFHKLSEANFFPYTSVTPTTFGVLLYAAANNRLDDWQMFDRADFGNFPEVPLPTYYAPTLEELLKKVDSSQ